MVQISIYTTITTILFLLIFLKQQPIPIVWNFISMLFTSKKFALHFVGMLVILYINKLELQLEERLQLDLDFTEMFYNIEGHFVSWIQSVFDHHILTVVLVFFYVVVFQSLLVTSICIYTYTKQYKLFYALCYAVMLNYLIAIPFYLFFPIDETWAFAAANVEFRMLDVFPTFEETYRKLSGLDNCFPSLHTSLSVTLAVLAFHSKQTLWKWFVGISAVIIIFSIFYLGIHWLLDMLGGLALGTFASITGLKLAKLDVQLPFTKNK